MSVGRDRAVGRAVGRQPASREDAGPAPIRPAGPSTAPAAARHGHVSRSSRAPCAPTTTSSWARATTRSTRCSPSPTTRWRRRVRCWRRPSRRRAARLLKSRTGRPTPSGPPRRRGPRGAAPRRRRSAPSASGPSRPRRSCPARTSSTRPASTRWSASARATPARRRVRRARSAGSPTGSGDLRRRGLLLKLMFRD